MSVCLDSVANTSHMEMAVLGPGRANHLLVLAGTAAFSCHGKGVTWRKDSVMFPVGETTLWPHQVIDVVAAASLADIPHDPGGSGSRWAIDRVSAHLDPDSRQIMLKARMALRDTEGFMVRLAFHVTVLAEVDEE